MAIRKSGTTYTMVYEDMHGADLSPEGSEGRFAYLENMYRDREGGGGGIETVPGFRKLADLGARVHAIHPHPTERGVLLLHAGQGLYRYPIGWRDTGAAPEKCTGTPLADRESRAATDGGSLWLADGARYTRLTAAGLTPAEREAYRPTVYADGTALEQQNLLTPLAYEAHHLYDLSAYAYRTEEGFTFKLRPDGRCLIERYTGGEALVVLPTEATVNGRRLPVAGVACAAFLGNETVTTLILPQEISELEPSAFAEMQALHTVVLTGGVDRLPDSCFSDCPRLSTLYIGIGLAGLSSTAFRNTALTDVHFAGDGSAFIEIDGHDLLRHVGDGAPMHYLSVYHPCHCLFPLKASVAEITDVTLDGIPLPTEEISVEALREGAAGDERIRAVRITASEAGVLCGKTLSLGVRLTDGLKEALGGAHPTYAGDGAAAINGCRLITRYDGRLFLSGNPALPGTVFYTGRRADGEADPTYIGLYQHFTDGDGRSEVRALLATATHLLVMLADTMQGPAVYRHEGRDSDSDVLPRIYPAADAVSDVGAVGDAILFYDDPLFLSARGLEAVEAVTLTLSQERRLAHRSACVDPLLLEERLSSCRLFRFGTYLGIAAESGRVYLADGYERARGNRSTGYDWYLLSDVGSYTGQRDRYRYVTHAVPAPLVGQSVYPRLDGPPRPIVLSATSGYAAEDYPIVSGNVNGYAFAYQTIGGKAVLVDTDGEKHGGQFSPATAFLESGGLLFFGTGDGGLFVFNTDKREADGSIPRRYYSFNGRAYRSMCVTRWEDGGLPHLKKQILRGEGAVCLGAMSGGRVSVKAAEDGGTPTEIDTLYCGRLDFCETDFATVEYGTGRTLTLPLREPPSQFVRRSVTLVSEEYMRPFGVISIAYRYRVAGRI